MAITMTERAANEVQRIFRDKNMPPQTRLRVGIKGGGCSGFSYTLDVATRAEPEDQEFDSHGLQLVCDPKSYLYLNGTEIDYDESLMSKGFLFNNPNAKGTCACGASFNT